MTTNRPNILVICARNKKRSRTAEAIFKNDDRFNIRSAGLSASSVHNVSEKDLHWADLILVMEKNHRSKLEQSYSRLELPKIEILDIKDDYEFMDETLILMLTKKIDEYLTSIV